MLIPPLRQPASLRHFLLTTRSFSLTQWSWPIHLQLNLWKLNLRSFAPPKISQPNNLQKTFYFITAHIIMLFFSKSQSFNHFSYSPESSSLRRPLENPTWTTYSSWLCLKTKLILNLYQTDSIKVHLDLYLNPDLILIKSVDKSCVPPIFHSDFEEPSMSIQKQ